MTAHHQHPPAGRARNDRATPYVVLVVVAMTALAVTGVYLLFGRGLDEAGARTCGEFASSRYLEVTEVADRVAIADLINRMAAKSNSDRLAKGARALRPAATGTLEEWRTAARAMDQTCVDEGWVPD